MIYFLLYYDDVLLKMLVFRRLLSTGCDDLFVAFVQAWPKRMLSHVFRAGFVAMSFLLPITYCRKWRCIVGKGCASFGTGLGALEPPYQAKDGLVLSGRHIEVRS